MSSKAIGALAAAVVLSGGLAIAAPGSGAAGKPQAATALAYPPCSKTVTDHCIQLWQPSLRKAYPACAKIRPAGERAACIEKAFATTGK
jgi:hypothetical protein